MESDFDSPPQGEPSHYEQAQAEERHENIDSTNLVAQTETLNGLYPWQHEFMKHFLSGKPVNVAAAFMPRRSGLPHALMHLLAEMEGITVVCGVCNDRRTDY